MLSDVGWLNVISIMGILIFGCSFGIFFMYKGRNTKVRLLFYMGLAIFFNGLWYWGNFWESLSILITGKNFDHSIGISIPYELQAIMSFIWPPVSVILFTYVFTSLIIPDKKWYILSFYLATLIIWEIFLFINPLGSLSIYWPGDPGTDLIDEDFIPGSPLSTIAMLYIVLAAGVWGSSLIFKGIQSSGVMRKKYFYIAAGNVLIPLFGTIEAFGAIGVTLFFARIGLVISFWCFYFGLREEPIRIEGISATKEVKVEDSLFRIAKRPTQITEEEVTYYREQKICLVCKGGVGGFNTYICTGCDALYCENCARALSNMENVCWACNEPIDKSKPSKPFKIEEVEAESKKSEEIKQ